MNSDSGGSGWGSAIGAGIGALGQLGGAAMSSGGAREAAAAQERIAAQNIAFQKDMYNQNVARMDPWVQYGKTQMNALAEQMPALTSKYDYAKYTASPEYQNTMATTARQQNQLQAQAAASGMYGSGTMANQLQNNAAYLAQQGYQQGLQNYMGQNQSIYNMLNQQSQTGLNAAGQQVGSGNQLASNVGNIMGQNAQAQGNALNAAGQAWGNALSGIGNIGSSLAGQWSQNQQQQALLNKYLQGTGSQQSTPVANSMWMNPGTATPSYVATGMDTGNWTGNPALNNLLY